MLKFNKIPVADFETEQVLTRAKELGAIIIDDVYTRRDVLELLSSLDVYVSLHRSEGFGLTCAEAMALGVPVIASGYSGNLDFMNAENSLLVPVQRITTDRPYGPYPAGTVWGEPDLQVAAELMVSLLARSRRKTLGKKGQESVRRQLSRQSVGALVKNLLWGTSSQQLIQQYESGIPGQ